MDMPLSNLFSLAINSAEKLSNMLYERQLYAASTRALTLREDLRRLKIDIVKGKL